MRIPFDCQLKSFFGNGRFVSSTQDAKGYFLPLISGTIAGQSGLDRARVHRDEHAFLKALIVRDTREESRQMHDNLAKAERDGKCIRRALFFVVVLFLLCLAGLSYCAILKPEIFRNSRHLAMRSLYVLGLASLMSQGTFLGYLFWHRVVVSRLHHECRRLVLTLVESQLKAAPDPIPARKVNGESPGASASAPVHPTGIPSPASLIE